MCSQEILDPIFKSLASDTSVKNWGGIDWGNVAYSSLLGGLSSGVFELSSSVKTNFNQNKIDPDEVISGMWEDSPNRSKDIVEKSQLESVESFDENGIIKEAKVLTLDNLTKEILKTKPPNSRIPKDWIEAGGDITIDKYGNWIYTDWFGISVKYIDGYPDYNGAGAVVQEVDIGGFISRGIDKRLADKLAPNGPCNKGNVWHHSQDGRTMQEVDGEIHRRFTHKGGHSLWKRKELTIWDL